jgi:hypothetical protein
MSKAMGVVARRHVAMLAEEQRTAAVSCSAPSECCISLSLSLSLSL